MENYLAIWLKNVVEWFKCLGRSQEKSSETSDSTFNRLRENQRYSTFNLGIFSRTGTDSD